MARFSMRTLRFEHLLTAGGFRAAQIVIDDTGRIAAVESAESGPWDGWIALPGMVNAHSHAFQRVMTGLAERSGGERSFWGWRELMYRIAQQLTAADQFAVAARAFAEMLAAGYTSVGEFHYLHHGPGGEPGTAMADAVTAAAQATGIRLALLPVYYARGGFSSSASPQQRRFVHADATAFLDYVAQLGPGVRGIAPHSLRAVEVAELDGLVRGARERIGDEAVVHMHIAEQRREVEECLAATGHTPVALLREHVRPDRRWSFVHATHAGESELDALRNDQATVVLCPLTEANLGDGIFPATRFAQQGGRMAIGSDCNARIDAIEELRLLEYGQRLLHERRPCLGDEHGTGMGLWASCARAGARSLNLDVGEIAAGRAADLVVLEQRAPLEGLAPEQALDAWLVGGSREHIVRTYVGGEAVTPASVPPLQPIVSRLARYA